MHRLILMIHNLRNYARWNCFNCSNHWVINFKTHTYVSNIFEKIVTTVCQIRPTRDFTVCGNSNFLPYAISFTYIHTYVYFSKRKWWKHNQLECGPMIGPHSSLFIWYIGCLHIFTAVESCLFCLHMLIVFILGCLYKAWYMCILNWKY